MLAKEIEIYTDKYKQREGKIPRGNNKWRFVCYDKSGVKYRCQFEGLYKESKRKAIRFAIENECYIIDLI